MSVDSYGINGQGQLWHSSTPEAELSAPFASRDIIGMGVVPGKKQIFLTYGTVPLSGACSLNACAAFCVNLDQQEMIAMVLYIAGRMEIYCLRPHSRTSLVRSCIQLSAFLGA